MTSSPTAFPAAGGAIPEWTLGDRLRKARQFAALEQSEMATDLGIARNSVANYELGHTTPRRPVLLAWSLRTGVSLEWLMSGRVNTSPDPATDGDAGWAPRGSNPQPADYKFASCNRSVTEGDERVIPFPRRLWPVPEARTAAA